MVASVLIPVITRSPQEVAVGWPVLQKECYLAQRKMGVGLSIPSINEHAVGYFLYLHQCVRGHR